VPVVSEPSLDDDPRCTVVSYDHMSSFCLDLLQRELARTSESSQRLSRVHFCKGSYEMDQRYLDLLESCLLDDIYGSQDLTSGRAATDEEVNQGLIWPARARTSPHYGGQSSAQEHPQVPLRRDRKRNRRRCDRDGGVERGGRRFS